MPLELSIARLIDNQKSLCCAFCLHAFHIHTVCIDLIMMLSLALRYQYRSASGGTDTSATLASRLLGARIIEI